SGESSVYASGPPQIVGPVRPTTVNVSTWPFRPRYDVRVPGSGSGAAAAKVNVRPGRTTRMPAGIGGGAAAGAARPRGGGGRRRPPGRVLADRQQPLGVRPAAAGGGPGGPSPHGPRVARQLRLFAQPVPDVPEQRVPPPRDPGRQLQPPDPVVPPPDVGQLVP